MKILMAHNFYQQAGGEDVVFEQERRLLERNGHTVITYIRSNHEIEQLTRLGRIGLLKTIVSSNESRRQVAKILKSERPDIVHVHNTLMMISPSIFDACAEAGIPAVLTLHNYRLLCPTVTLYRQGAVCEECPSHGMLQAVRHRCYRESRIATAAVVTMLKYHQVIGTWSRKVSAYIVLTEFARKKFSANGVPAERIHVKPNFVDPDPGIRTETGNYFLLVGRLSPEKGLMTLLHAWESMPGSVLLKIAGDGPLRQEAEDWVRIRRINNVEFVGKIERNQTIALMKEARAVIVPSLWYEGFPMVMVESFACGVPVLGSRLGAMQELIENGVNGLHFTPGHFEDLKAKVQWAWENREEMAVMGNNARQKYEMEYETDANYRRLLAIYASARQVHAGAHVMDPNQLLEATE